MTAGPPKGSDVWTGLIRPSDIETMDAMGRTISSRAGFHYGRIGFNLRKPPMNDVNFRHALAHLLPKDLIVGTIFKYVVVKVSTMVPPAQSLYHNPNVDPHPYSRAVAEQILIDSTNYVKIGGVWKYKDGTDLETLRFFTPLETVAPTSYTMGRMFVDECRAIGVMNIDHQPADFSTYVDMVFNKWDFEMFMVFHGLSRFPTQVYTQMNTINNVLGSANPHGITTPGVVIDGKSADYYSNIVWTSLDPSAIEEAAKKCQELIMGGSITDPLLAPAQNTATDNRTMAVPHIPIYSRNLYDIQHQQLRGSVNYFGVGVDNNAWTWPSLYWNTPDGGRPGQSPEMGPTGLTTKIVVYTQTEIPDATLNPLFSTTVYGVRDIMGRLYDGLVAVNPYNHRDEDWIAYQWSFGAEQEGMYVKFKVRLTDSEGNPILWQDGTPIKMSDLKFAMDFLGPRAVTPRPAGGWEIPIYWSVMRFYTGSSISGDEFTCHFSTTSPWFMYTVAGNSLILPPQVWAKDPAGNDWTSTAAIIGYKPSNYPYLVGSCKNRLFGTGPWVLQHSVDHIRSALYADFWANRNYWKTTDEFQNFISDMFHRSGDVDRSGMVDVSDLAAIGANMWTAGPTGDIIGPIAPTPGPWPEPKKDGQVDSLDLAVAGKYYGETERVP
jgi:ABC-type transport system substrate-binding protein